MAANLLDVHDNGCAPPVLMEREEWGQKLVFDAPERATVATVLQLLLVDPACGFVLRSPVQWTAHAPLLLSLLRRYLPESEQRAYCVRPSFERSCLA